MEKFEILFELEKSLHTFEVRSSAAKIAGLLSPDFFEFGSSGIRTEVGIKTEFLRSSVWRKNSDGWQMEFHQGTVKK